MARGILRAAAEGCAVINLSLALAPGPGAEVLAEACAEALAAGCTLVAAGRPGQPGLWPAALPGVLGAVAEDGLAAGQVSHRPGEPYPYAASGRPRDLAGLPPGANLWGHSFACARVAAWAALGRPAAALAPGPTP
ncbi:MAG: hypothetical protein ACYDA8_18410, partial [Deferrisomatales bacterium]